MLSAGGFQLVVADLELPDMDGVDLARRMRGEPSLGDLPFVLVTGRKGRVEDVRAASAGVQAVVARPYQPDRLLAEVERVLAEARVTRQRTILRRYLSGEALAAMERFVDTGGVSSRAALRHRTVLFADLAGFTALCEDRDAEDVVKILNRFFDATVPTLVRHGASIDKFIGDCIMAVYDGEAVGARGAVAGALEVVQTVVPALQAELGISLNLRVGINSGLVIVGDIGSRDFRRDYTVIGDAVNVAQRIQSNAQIGEILVGDSTRMLVTEFFQFGEARQLQLKGRNASARAYPVTSQG
jgi:class 3 adenylate cyclase